MSNALEGIGIRRCSTTRTLAALTLDKTKLLVQYLVFSRKPLITQQNPPEDILVINSQNHARRAPDDLDCEFYLEVHWFKFLIILVFSAPALFVARFCLLVFNGINALYIFPSLGVWLFLYVPISLCFFALLFLTLESMQCRLKLVYNALSVFMLLSLALWLVLGILFGSLSPSFIDWIFVSQGLVRA
jgi:hypothetical protein